jgi:hypothetical protein
MTIAPFSSRPGSPERESRQARLVLVIATVGIAATLLAYAVSPGVRHAVGHAAHSVNHAVSHVFDRDKARAAHPAQPVRAKSAPQPKRSSGSLQVHTNTGGG